MKEVYLGDFLKFSAHTMGDSVLFFLNNSRSERMKSFGANRNLIWTIQSNTEKRQPTEVAHHKPYTKVTIDLLSHPLQRVQIQ